MLRRKLPEKVGSARCGMKDIFSSSLVLFAALLTLSSNGAVAGEGHPADDDEQLQEEMEEEFELLSMQEQVVTATKHTQSVAEAPAVVAVITRENIRERGYRNVAEAVASVPGIYVSYDYVFYDVGMRGISNELRGASRSIKVLINGQDVSFRAETSNFLGPELIPLAAVDRIEIIRGPASALYGANAFLGLVNIITRDGRKAEGVSLGISGQLFREAYGGVGLELAAGSSLGPLDFFLALSHSYQERSGQKIRCTAAVAGEGECDYAGEVTRRLLGRPSFDDIAQPSSFFSRLALDIGELFARPSESLGRLSLQGSVQLLDSRGSFSDWGSLNHDDVLDAGGQVVGHLAGSGNRVALSNASFRGDYEFGLFEDRLHLKLGGAYGRGGPLDSERLEEVTGPVNRSDYGYESFDIQAEIGWTAVARPPAEDGGSDSTREGSVLDELEFSVGVDFSSDEITYAPVGGAASMSFITSTLDNLGLWGQAASTLLGDRLGLVAGVRYDRHQGARLNAEALQRLDPSDRERLCGEQVCYQMLSWRTGATWQILENSVLLGEQAGYLLDRLYLKVLYGTAFKAPSPTFLYQEDFLGERPLNPNPALRPQTISSLEFLLGSVHWGRRLEFSLNFFLNDLKDRAEFDREGMAVVAKNGVPVRSWGLEGELHLRLGALEVYGSLSYQRSRRSLGENVDQRIPDTFGYPDLMAATGVSWDIRAVGLLANLEVNYVGRRVGHPFNRSDRIGERYTLGPYALVNLNLATSRWNPLAGKETRLQLGVRNLLDTRYDFPGFQPYYRYDVPGLPRTLVLSLEQEI